MNGVIEALHILDEHDTLLLSHTYTSRPLPAAALLPLYLSHPAPRPNLIYLPNVVPPTLVFSLRHGSLTLLLTSSQDIEPLLALEFLHRVVDALEEFLGAPVTSSKIEGSYDIVAQLLTEMCDAGVVSTTEPNALREMVEVEGFLERVLGGVGLNAKTPSSLFPQPPILTPPSAPALPWRRTNVRHTSNELYADLIESLSITLAPSGRPLAAFAHGTIVFTAKVSGIPDIVVTLTSSGGKHALTGLIDLPVFHPCVRLARWKEQPGVLSFVPPDGRFTLAGYEVDLLPLTETTLSSQQQQLKLPVSLDIKTGLGPTGSDFELRLTFNKSFTSTGSVQPGLGRSSHTPTSSSSVSAPSLASFATGTSITSAGSSSSPTLHDLKVTVPLPPAVRNLSEIRPSKGDANFHAAERILEWSINNKELSQLGSVPFMLRCTVVGDLDSGEASVNPEDEMGFPTQSYHGYDPSVTHPPPSSGTPADPGGDAAQKQQQQNKILMPTSASLSFSVRGWLASGLRVESIVLDTRKSRGIGEGVKPYKGVKYLTLSKEGVEVRC
ncbi:complex subunit mu-like protein [Thermochaetoides thermophila DSM 1495]|uniref:Complex subunit mu-like protein n=1 Tax=Chaetomium thermophilum (strain DSM 1495 / CBS 144.50 / IMI 039719) TaxID=759272 RepID=G0S9A2_CHATD|nr:complex subunit mu-like protein [Thermochaetoides thermophila DSM 1495]EGS20013.1 complex subunit mu-like protein [Thermochaetoides thermophila DSM 1495]